MLVQIRGDPVLLIREGTSALRGWPLAKKGVVDDGVVFNYSENLKANPHLLTTSGEG